MGGGGDFRTSRGKKRVRSSFSHSDCAVGHGVGRTDTKPQVNLQKQSCTVLRSGSPQCPAHIHGESVGAQMLVQSVQSEGLSHRRLYGWIRANLYADFKILD